MRRRARQRMKLWRSCARACELEREAVVSTPSADSPRLRVEHLARAVKDKILVDDANFEVQSGGVLAIVGPSGAGKTSLLRLLNRLDAPPQRDRFSQRARLPADSSA